ncbi:putative minor capsid protein [Halalkalibacterium ligniniphilum]|uniref:putative minor capsid protein n=1 Tax=Halalkalibacterium ligniniphilum TaxID=1134413 RepID=UPI000347B8A5|nr:putative minor capsid protein [Halalkalibacterium ligniniphilum]
MRIKPIPRRFLIHSIEYEEFVRDGSFGEEFAPSETISFVLVQPKSELKRDSNGEEVQVQGVIFLDAVNTPKFKRLREKSKVKFNGNDYRIVACDALYAFKSNTPHHYEVDIR